MLENSRYDDIIHLERPKSKHPKMSMSKRAGQFSPFQALGSAQGEAVKETNRITEEWKELDENIKIMINEELQKISSKLKSNPEIVVTHFVPDKTKSGGAYVTTSGKIKKIDEYTRKIIMLDGDEISIDRLYEIGLKNESI